LVTVKNVMVSFVHLLEHIRLKVFLTTLATYSRWHIADDKQASPAPVIVLNLFWVHLSATKRAISKARHGRLPLVRGSCHFGGYGIETVMILRISSASPLMLAHPNTA
jgi:hypothetical protein